MDIDQLSKNEQLALAMIFVVVVGTWRSLGYSQRIWPKTSLPKLLAWTVATWTVFVVVVMSVVAVYFHFFPPQP